MIDIPQGIYRHHSGYQVDVIGVALHVETGEELIIFRPMGGSDRHLRALTVAEFTEPIFEGGKPRPAFEMVLSNEIGPVDRKK